MKKIRYGIVGLGNQGSYYLGLFLDGKIENGEISALCDHNINKLNKAAERCGGRQVRAFLNYKEMLDGGVCDAVLVETPHYIHPEIVSECLKRGINVICDKPAGVYTKQVREMNEVAKKSEAHFAMLFNQRTNCVYRKMKEIIASGGIGELQRVNWIITNWFRTQKYYDSGSWRATWNGEGGGVLINQCPHQIDLVQWVVGKMPKTVRGFCQYGKWHDIEVEDEVTAFFEYDNGATGVFITTTGEAPGGNRLEISGTKGKLLCEGQKLTWYKLAEDILEWSAKAQDAFSMPKMEIIEPETDGKNEQHTGIINNFTNALLGKEEFFVDGTEGINGVELMNAIEFSGWNGGKKIVLPVDEVEYLKELNKHRAHSILKEADDNCVIDNSMSYGIVTEK